jgi:hypothetical protein
VVDVLDYALEVVHPALFVCRFQKELIFKFSPKHWRLWNFYPVRGWWPKKFVPNWYEGSESS